MNNRDGRREKERERMRKEKGETTKERKEEGKTKRKKETASRFCFFSGMDPLLACPLGLKMKRRGQRRRR